MPYKSRQDVYDFLHSLGITFTIHEHPAVFTCEQAAQYDCGDVADCKNLFLTDGAGAWVLAVLRAEQRLNVKALARTLGIKTLRFAPAEDLLAVLGLMPGAVTPFGLLNDTERRVTLALDEGLTHSPRIQCHPNDNEATITLDTADFLRVMGSLGYTPRLFNTTPG